MVVLAGLTVAGNAAAETDDDDDGGGGGGGGGGMMRGTPLSVRWWLVAAPVLM